MTDQAPKPFRLADFQSVMKTVNDSPGTHYQRDRDWAVSNCTSSEKQVFDTGWAYGYRYADARSNRQPIKPHQVAKLVNDLHDVAKCFHNTGQLRERIAYLVRPLATYDQPSEPLTEDTAPVALEALMLDLANTLSLYPRAASRVDPTVWSTLVAHRKA